MENKKNKRCSIKNCPTTSESRFFRFPNPKYQDRVIQWKIACGDENIMKKDPSALYATNRICSDHFEASYMSGRYLNKAALPTLNLFLKPQSRDIVTQTENSQQIIVVERHIVNVPEIHVKQEVKEHVETQTTQDLSANSPRKTKLRMLLKEKQRKIKQLETKIARLETELTKCQQMNCSQEGSEEICLVFE